LVSTNREGFIFLTQLAVNRMLSPGSGGGVTSIATSLVENPISSLTASVPMITKGGLDAITWGVATVESTINLQYKPAGKLSPVRTGVTWPSGNIGQGAPAIQALWATVATCTL
jgi:hypothetical protein